MAGLHHVELWVPDPSAADWDWLLPRLGYALDGEWPDGRTWIADDGAYLTFTTSPNLAETSHDRRRPGLNHLAFLGGTSDEVDAVMTEAPAHGWTPLYHERYPHAGGPDHYAGWLENAAGFKVEIVRSSSRD